MPSEKTVISAIVPAYNSRETLGGCLRALRAQSGLAPGELEIIVVDDGSGDGSASEARGLCDALVVNEHNLGAAAARNRGAAQAEGEYLLFVDADVVLIPGAAATLRQALAADPAAAAAVGRYTETPAAEGIVNVYHNAFTRYHHDLSPRDIDWFWGALGMVKKQAFVAAGGFDERYRGASAEDMEFGLALSRAGFRAVYVPEAEGAHAHHFTLRSMLVNDYKKAVLGMKLRMAGRLPRRAPRFASLGNTLTAPILSMLGLSLAASLGSSYFLLLACLMIAMLLVVNEKYYRYLQNHMEGNLDMALLLHWVQMFAVSLGAALGMFGRLLGRSPYGRPGWF